MTPPTPSWFEHVDLMQVIIGTMFMVLGWFMIRTLHSVEKSICILFKKYEEIDKNHDQLRGEFYQLRGEHIARHSVIIFFLSFSMFLHSAQAADIAKTLTVIYGHEGGLQCDPSDPGNWSGGKVGLGKQGCTRYGIATNTYPNEDIRHLTLKRASELYKRDFWNPLHLDELKSQGLATEVMDTAVNCGVGTSARIVQRSANHLNGKGKDYPVDGHITPAEIAWINFYTHEKANRLRFYKLLNGYQLGRYIEIIDRNPRMEKYLNSWLSRVNW